MELDLFKYFAHALKLDVPAPTGKKSQSLKKGPFGRMTTATLAAARTNAYQLDLEAPFVALRLWLPNAHTAAVTGLHAMAYAQDTLGTATGNDKVLVDYQGNINQAQDFAWGGASSPTLPARLGNERPSWTKSDWMSLSSVARADGGVRPLLGFRVDAPSGTVATVPYGNCDGWLTGGATDGRVIRKYAAATTAGSRANWYNLAGARGETENKNFWPFVIEYALASSVGEQWMGSGDSNTEGYGSTETFYSHWMRACLRGSTPAAPRDYFNAGIHAQGVNTFTDYLSDNLTEVHPDVVVYSPYSINDISGEVSTFNIDQAKGGLGRVGATLASKKAALIVNTGLPCNTSFKGYMSDARRRAFNDGLIELPRNLVVVADIATPVSGVVGANDQIQILAGSTVDGVHLSEAGHNLAATAIAAARSKLVI